MPIYLSASSIADFIRCPQKVLYRIKKTVPQVQSKEMIVGQIAHYALEKGWKDRDRAYEILKQESSRQELSKTDLTNLQFMIDIFFLNFKRLLGENDLIEFNFKLSLYDDVFIVGKLDRISGGNLYDWKTASRLPSKLSNDVQCIVYDWAFQKHFGIKAKSISVASLAKGELIPYVEDKMYVKEIFDNIIPRMIRTIKNESYERLGMFNHSCFKCPYKSGCLERTNNVLDSPEFME